MSAFGTQGSGSTFGQQSGGSLFGNQTGASSGNNNSTFGFGQPSAVSNQSANAFGNSSIPASTLGNTAKRTQSFGGPSGSSGGGLFGSAATTSGTQGNSLLGNNQSASGGPAAGLFGNNSSAAKTGFGTSGSSGSLFGNTASSGSTNPPTQGAGLVGQSQQQAKPLFEQSSGGGLFGSTQSSSSTGAGSSLFGSGGNQTSSGIFGSNNTSTQTNPTASTGMGLFNNTNPSGLSTGGLFGKPSKAPVNTMGSTGAAGGTSDGRFGNSGSTGGLFGSASASNLGSASLGSTLTNRDPQAQQSPKLIATIDQASFTLHGTSPSASLYKSLTVPPPKRSMREANTYNYAPPKPQTLSAQSRHTRAKAAHSLFKPGPPPGPTASIAGPLRSRTDRMPASITGPSASTSSAEPRQWINSYDRFLRERPTTLEIKRDRKRTVFIAEADAPVSSAPPAIAAAIGDSTSSALPAKPAAESSFASEKTNLLEGDVSLFHRQANNMTLVRVNKKALKEGYYIYPKLEDLAAMSKTQLAAVQNLVIGREGYGQIEYSGVVDLSQINNLGDVLGTLVVFDVGTVCVYPDEGTKAAPGHELNLPATVTIENAWPVDSKTHHKIKDMEDHRMAKHVARLREACESRGGEFVTFTQGIWVFKVPHFSKWGLPADEMVVDDDDGVSVLGSLASESPVLAEDGLNYEGSAVDGVDDMEADGVEFEAIPETWLEQLRHASSGVLLAATEALAAASVPTAELDLNEMLMPTSEENASDARTLHDEAMRDDDRLEFSLDTSKDVLRLSSLRKSVTKEDRAGSTLPLLHTSLTFDELSSLAPTQLSLWSLLSSLYESKDAEKEGFVHWLDKKARGLNGAEPSGALDRVWFFLLRHDVNAAAAEADKADSPHLKLLLLLLGDKANQTKELNELALHRLSSWKDQRQIVNISEPVRRVWELLAGSIPKASKLSWPQWIGLRFWYSDSSIKDAVTSIPASMIDKKDPELMFLLYWAGGKQLRNAVSNLSLVNAFLCLQALESTSTNEVRSDSHCLDSICSQLSDSLRNADDLNMAIYVALHITDVKLAADLVRKSLLDMPASSSVPADFGLPEKFLNESRASQVARSGEYASQAEYLLRAGQYEQAHRVVVAEVGPHAVISHQFDSLWEILSVLEKNKLQLRHWDIGGNVYWLYVRGLRGESKSTLEISTLCSACQYAETPNYLSKMAISKISQWVTENPAGAAIEPTKILKMKFSPSQRRVQILQQSSRLLLE